MERKRKLSSYFRNFTGKCKTLKSVRTERRCQQAVFGWLMLRERKIGVEYAIVILFAVCGFAQSAATSPDQTERRIDSILSHMTIEEKVDLLGGVDGFYVRGVPRLGVPRFKMADGPLGVRNDGSATTMAAGIALAATWNPGLAERVGAEIGRDARAKGVHFLLGPGGNIYRAPMNGRDFEYFREDPFLASRIAVGYIKRVQSQGVSAT